jgi:hypothetical protein
MTASCGRSRNPGARRGTASYATLAGKVAVTGASVPVCDCRGCAGIRARDEFPMPYYTTLWIELRHVPQFAALAMLLGVAS